MNNEAQHAQELWQLWLQTSMDTSEFTPVELLSKSNNLQEYHFKNINKSISLVITFDEYVESMIYFFDINAKAIDHIVLGWEPVASSDEKLISKVFEPILKFTQQKFTPQYKLYILDNEQLTHGFISNKKDEYTMEFGENSHYLEYDIFVDPDTKLS